MDLKQCKWGKNVRLYFAFSEMPGKDHGSGVIGWIDCDFSALCYLHCTTGIVVDSNLPLEKVVLRAYGNERYYLRDLPLHHSQREIGKTEEYTDFELHIKTTFDFKTQLFSRGAWLQVIEPQSLADEMIEWHQSAVERYKK